jgi:hypothetical protein
VVVEGAGFGRGHEHALDAAAFATPLGFCFAGRVWRGGGEKV